MICHMQLNPEVFVGEWGLARSMAPGVELSAWDCVELVLGESWMSSCVCQPGNQVWCQATWHGTPQALCMRVASKCIGIGIGNSREGAHDIHNYLWLRAAKTIQSSIDSLHGPQPLTFRFMIHGWIQTSSFWFVMSWEYSVCRVFVSCWPRGMSCAFWNPRTSSHRRWLQTCIEWLRKCTICNFMQHLVTGVGVKAAWHMSDIYGTALSGWQNQVTKSWHVENVGKKLYTILYGLKKHLENSGTSWPCLIPVHCGMNLFAVASLRKSWSTFSECC